MCARPRDNGTNPRIDPGALAADRAGEAGEELGFWRRVRRWSERVHALRALLAVVVLLSVGGGAAMIYAQSLAKRSDVDAVRELGRKHERDHDLRLALLERDLAWITRTLYDLSIRSGVRPAAPPERSAP